MAQPLLALQELSKYYINGQNVVAGLNKVSLSFERGEFVAVTGESGSGKSTLAHILGGILPYEDGELYIEGKPTSHYDSADWERYRAESVGFISQSYGILPGATVEENVISALRLTGMDKQKALAEARSILEEVELWTMRSRRAAKLSSGQKQRLSIARALAKPCAVLIADEPTGNLDPENSEKVIRLLAKAARDRLVILITHEFSEAEDHVTRHISMQDGQVCADARLRAVAPVEDTARRRRNSVDLSGFIAGLQMRSRPAWSVVMLLFMTLTAFAVFAFLGSFIVALDDTSTRIYDSQAFLNGDKSRIVVERYDQQPMTEEDYEAILSIRNVELLDRFGYVCDISYAYQEDVDYEINYTRHNYGTRQNPAHIELETPEFIDTTNYLKTVPMYDRSEAFLSDGRLPQCFREVVAADSELLGKTIVVYIRNEACWELGEYLKLEMTVVGVTELGSGLYFHDDLARTLTLDYLGGDYTYIPYYDDILSEGEYINYRDSRSKLMYGELCAPFYTELRATAASELRPMSDSEVYVSHDEYVNVLLQSPAANFAEIYRTAYSTGAGEWSIAGIHQSTVANVLAVSPASFQRIIEESGIGNSDQVSITITDYAYTDRVLKELEKAGYYALSPYVLGSAQIDPELAAQRWQTLFICTGALLVVILLQLIVMKAMFSMENESYRTLSDMGLTCRTAQRSVFWQVLAFTVAGQLLGLLCITLCSFLNVQRIADLTKYLFGSWWLVISLIHLASTMLAAWLIASGLRKKVYPRTARVRDLVIDDEEVA